MESEVAVVDLDLVISGGTVIDGTGRPRFRADVGIRDGRIAVVAPGEQLTGRRRIDATGLIVAPGFVDAHSHSEWIVPLADHDSILAPLILQGVTSMVAGNCGFSPAPVTDDSIPIMDKTSGMLREDPFPYRWRSMGEFLDVLEADGLVLNTAMLVGHGAIRHAVMGERPDEPAPAELDVMADLIRQSVREGAFGLSTGLGYTPGMYAKNDELLKLLEVLAEEDAVYAVHNRTYRWASPFYEPMTEGTPHNVRSVQEQLELARAAGARLQISHLIFVGRRTWHTYPTVLQLIDEAAEAGLDVAFDAFPYTFGNTTINVNFPKWFLLDLERNLDDPEALQRLEAELDWHCELIGRGYEDIIILWTAIPELAHLDGLDVATIAERLGVSPFEAYVSIARKSRGSARILQDTFSGDANSEGPLRDVLSHPRCAFMLDTILTRKGKPNPASLGTFPRILGRYSRDLGLFSLEEAVRRSTSFSAERFGLPEIGRVAEGLWADLVLFDPDTVADNTTRQDPGAAPTGIEAVLISGQVVAQGGERVDDVRRGRVLRR
jgi:N-acyl-D-amino-acid deacylase